MIWPESAFWTYSLGLYGQPGVKGACLSLQDRRGLDVNLVLFAFWLAKGGMVLDRAGLARAEDALAGVRTSVVLPLRKVRRHLHAIDGRSPVADWPDEVRHLGNLVAKAELDGEHLCQLVLERLSATFQAGHAADATLAARNLGVVAAFKREDRASLRTLFAMAFPDLPATALAEAINSLDPV